MNIIRNLEQVITERLTETKNPCKGYSTYEAADKAGNDMAEQCGKLFDTTGRSARYVVFFHEGYGKFVAAIDLSELLARNTAMGGYVMYPASKGFYTF